jgi:hypothetical protein
MRILESCYLFFVVEIVVFYHFNMVSFLILKLRMLKERTLIVDFGDAVPGGVSVHDLYMEFAKMEVKLDTRYVWGDQRDDEFPEIVGNEPSRKYWKNVKRVFVMTRKHIGSQCRGCIEACSARRAELIAKGYSEHEAALRANYILESRPSINYDHEWKEPVVGIKWEYFPNVVVLEISVEHSSKFDLSALGGQLRSLNIEGRCEGVQLVGLDKMRTLVWLDLSGIDCATCFKGIGLLTALQVLRIRTELCKQEEEDSHGLELPEFDKCIHLQELVLFCPCLKAFPNLARMKSLREVVFEGCTRPTEVLGLGSHMAEMKELRLSRCESLRQFPGVGDIDSLQVLVVDGSALAVKEFPELNSLKKLRKLLILGCVNVLRLPQLAGLIALEEVELDGLDKLQAFPDMRGLEKLRKLTISWARKLLVLPQLTDLIALEEVDLGGLYELQFAPDIQGLEKLRKLTIRYAPKLLDLPQLADLIALEEV